MAVEPMWRTSLLQHMADQVLDFADEVFGEAGPRWGRLDEPDRFGGPDEPTLGVLIRLRLTVGHRHSERESGSGPCSLAVVIVIGGQHRVVQRGSGAGLADG
jgi:hypothetical protein